MKQKQNYMVGLENNNLLNLFWDANRFFTLKLAKEYITFCEELYPDNKGKYKLFEVKEVEQ